MTYQPVTATLNIYANLNSVWTDITSDQVGSLTANWGFQDGKPLSRISNAGTMRFTLRNTAGKYIPGVGSALDGWNKGTQVKVVITYDGTPAIPFIGRVTDLSIQVNPGQLASVNVTVADWMDYANKFPVVSPTIIPNIDAGTAVKTILAGMPIQPTETMIDTGVQTFPTTFDTVTTKTTAYTEFNKLCLSEMGYMYLKHNKHGSGEQLVFENAFHRNGLRNPDNIPLLKSASGYLLKANSATDHILTATSGNKIIPALVKQNVISAVSGNTESTIDATFGQDMCNHLIINDYPKTTDASPQTLYQSGAIKLASGQTLTVKGKYTAVKGGNDVNSVSTSMIQPDATDVFMNTAKDFSGTDETAQLTYLPVDYGTEAPVYTLTNNYTQTCWVKVRARGYGVYQDAPVTITIEDTASETLYGDLPLTLDQQYQDDTTLGNMFGKAIVEYEKSPRVKLKSLTMWANRSSDLMLSFLYLDVGDMTNVVEAQSGATGWYYIQGVSFTAEPMVMGGVAGVSISFTWIVRQQLSIGAGTISPVGMEFHPATPDAINFGVLPQLTTLTKMSLSFWVNWINTGNAAATAISMSDSVSGWYVVFALTNGYLYFYNKYFPTYGSWYIGVTPGALHHLVITCDLTSPVQPGFYRDTIFFSMIQVQAPVGLYTPAPGASFVLGNTSNAVQWAGGYSLNGLLADVRIYNRIITSDENLAIRNGGAPSVTAGPLDSLVFQGPVVRTPELANYVDQTLTANLPVLDNVYGMVGAPNGNPIARAF